MLAPPSPEEKPAEPSKQSRSTQLAELPSLATAPALPPTAAEGYRELVELDRAQSVRRAPQRLPARALEPDRTDLAVLALIAALRHVLSSQVHRHVNPRRAHTTTQRRLKRLADAGMVERFQFHRRDGGGVPMCYSITGEGLGVLAARSVLDRSSDPTDGQAAAPRPSSASESGQRLSQARHDIHVAGWALALAGTLGDSMRKMRGPEESILQAPQRSTGEGRAALTPADLRLAGGRSPHDFLRTDAAGHREAVERFESLRPDALLELSGGIDLIIERDDRLGEPRAIAKLERYDHFLTGWSLHTKRYGRRALALPLVVFLCRDRSRARECAREADAVLCACRAYAGEYPFDWEYQGRERVLFVAERDAHEGILLAYGLARLPPPVRAAAAHGDPRAAEATILLRELPRG